jgi:hypothetical protein
MLRLLYALAALAAVVGAAALAIGVAMADTPMHEAGAAAVAAALAIIPYCLARTVHGMLGAGRDPAARLPGSD